jgi:hypothetical protein
MHITVVAFVGAHVFEREAVVLRRDELQEERAVGGVFKAVVAILIGGGLLHQTGGFTMEPYNDVGDSDVRFVLDSVGVVVQPHPIADALLWTFCGAAGGDRQQEQCKHERHPTDVAVESLAFDRGAHDLSLSINENM